MLIQGIQSNGIEMRILDQILMKISIRQQRNSAYKFRCIKFKVCKGNMLGYCLSDYGLERYSFKKDGHITCFANFCRIFTNYGE